MEDLHSNRHIKPKNYNSHNKIINDNNNLNEETKLNNNNNTNITNEHAISLKSNLSLLINEEGNNMIKPKETKDKIYKDYANSKIKLKQINNENSR